VGKDSFGWFGICYNVLVTSSVAPSLYPWLSLSLLLFTKLAVCLADSSPLWSWPHCCIASGKVRELAVRTGLCLLCFLRICVLGYRIPPTGYTARIPMPA